MILLWRKIKFGLLIGMIYSVYYIIRSSRTLKRLEISRNRLGCRELKQKCG